jgi:hypothetical protein
MFDPQFLKAFENILVVIRFFPRCHIYSEKISWNDNRRAGLVAHTAPGKGGKEYPRQIEARERIEAEDVKKFIHLVGLE